MTDVPLLEDIKFLLEEANVGIFGVNPSGWSIFISREPDMPDNAITLYDAPGDPPNPKYLLDFPRFQVRVRGLEYLEAQAKSEEVQRALLGIPSQTIGSIRYIGIYIVTGPFFLKADERGRIIFVTMYRVIKEPSTGGGGNRIPL